MGLLHQKVWGLVGTSYQGDRMNVGGSNTVNKFLDPSAYHISSSNIHVGMELKPLAWAIITMFITPSSE